MDLAKFNDLDIVLVCGLPGSGKSRFGSGFFKESGRRRVSRRDIRRMLYEMTTFGEPWRPFCVISFNSARSSAISVTRYLIILDSPVAEFHTEES